jgi:hypothetical protein
MRIAIIVALLASVVGAQAQTNVIPLQPSAEVLARENLLRDLARPPVRVITDDRGGLIHEYKGHYGRIEAAGSRVEVRGMCGSACTLVLHLPKERLCFASEATLAFHMPRLATTGKPSLNWGFFLYLEYPREVRDWIDSKGGYAKLPTDDYWLLTAPEMWKMGYRRCP